MFAAWFVLVVDLHRFYSSDLSTASSPIRLCVEDFYNPGPVIPVTHMRSAMFSEARFAERVPKSIVKGQKRVISLL